MHSTPLVHKKEVTTLRACRTHEHRVARHRTDTQTREHMHTCIHAYMHTCIHAYMHTYIHAYKHTCIHAYMHTCIQRGTRAVPHSRTQHVTRVFITHMCLHCSHVCRLFRCSCRICVPSFLRLFPHCFLRTYMSGCQRRHLRLNAPVQELAWYVTVVAFYSSDGTWTLRSCRPITSGRLSSPTNGVVSPTSESRHQQPRYWRNRDSSLRKCEIAPSCTWWTLDSMFTADRAEC